MTEVPGHAHYMMQIACVTRSKTVDKLPCYQPVPRHFWEILSVEHLKHEENDDQRLTISIQRDLGSLSQFKEGARIRKWVIIMQF